MANLHCKLVTGDENCSYDVHESNINTAQSGMLEHLQRNHPIWYRNLTEKERQSLPFKILRQMENATALI